MSWWQVQIEDRRPVRVDAASSMDAVVEELNKLGLRYRDTRFTVIPITTGQVISLPSNIHPIKKGKAR